MIDYKQFNLPPNPGCYLYHDKAGEIIYIGKAKSLRKRVSSYFTKRDHDDKTNLLVHDIASIEFIVTDTEVEALLLEAKLIRQHQPKYNIDLKQAERYAYLLVTDEPFPRILTARNKTAKGKYFGPYTDGLQRKTLQTLASRLFKLRTCKRLPKTVCLNFHLGLCTGPCEGKISKADYHANIEKAVTLLKGNNKELITSLTQEMRTAMSTLDYETAKERRDQLASLDRSFARQKVDITKTFNQDVMNVLYHEGKTLIQLFNITKGVISRRQSFTFESIESLDSFIKQYYYHHDIPQEVIVPMKMHDPLIADYLSNLRGSRVRMTVPVAGTKKALLDLLHKNLEQGFSDEEKPLVALQSWLNLPTVPARIECFDNSNLGPTETVGAMVHFFNGKPDKNNYRRFKIRTVAGQDDFAMMAELVRRRYTRLIAEQSPLPDLIVIDGGKGQLHAAVDVLAELNLHIPIIGLAKRYEEVYEPGRANPKRLPLKDPRIKLLQRIRNEAHRFAITYHRLRREKIDKRGLVK